MKKSMKKLVVFVMVFTIVVFIVSTKMVNAKDAMKTIEGTYAITGQTTCLASGSGFNDDMTPKLPGWMIQTINVLGTFTFNPDGTGECHRYMNALTFNTGDNVNSRANITVSVCDFPFTYFFNLDGTFTITNSEPVTGTSLLPVPGPDQARTYEINKVGFIGVFSKDTKSIILSAEPIVSTIHQYKEDGSQISSVDRICIHSYVLLPL